MRITNSMITGNTKTNINSNKVNVDKYNTQMTTQKKISKPSEDPVIAIRSLRLSTNLSHINQYVENNIPDADSWLDVTETALTNMKKILTDIRTQCVKGSSDTLTADDRKTIMNALTSLSEQVYTEGNADYAGRTVFTGYRTSSQLTFGQDEANTKYNIDQKFNYEDLEEKRYYTGTVEVPALVTISDPPAGTDTPNCGVQVEEKPYDRLRLAYGGIDTSTTAVTFSYTPVGGTETTLSTATASEIAVYENEDAWEAANQKTFGTTATDPQVVFIKSTGEFAFSKTFSAQLKSTKATMEVNYDKTGFEGGDVRPEYYYDCKDISDPANVVTYKKEDQTLDYGIANGITLTVNTQASDAFDTGIARDVNELMNVVTKAINANDKVDKIKAMMEEEAYKDPEYQAKLKTYYDAAKKEADYADDNLQKTFGSGITKFNDYMGNVNDAITNVGSMQDRLTLTQTRVSNQQETIKDLKSSNEDRDISDIIIDYYASYNAYQASLTAASKVGSSTLLDYLQNMLV